MIASETARSLRNPVRVHFSTLREFPLAARAKRHPLRTSAYIRGDGAIQHRATG